MACQASDHAVDNQKFTTKIATAIVVGMTQKPYSGAQSIGLQFLGHVHPAVDDCLLSTLSIKAKLIRIIAHSVCVIIFVYIIYSYFCVVTQIFI